MAQQTSYNNNPAAALAGMVTHIEGEIIWTKIAGAACGIGLLCSPGTASLSVPGQSVSLAANGEPGTVIPYPTGQTASPTTDAYFIGIPIFDPAFMGVDQIGTATSGTFSYGTYLINQPVPLLRKGVIWVYADAAVSQYTPVYVYTTAETNQPLGTFGAGSGTGKSIFNRGQWIMSTSAAGLCQMEVW